MKNLSFSMRNLPGLMILKDFQSTFLEITQDFAALLGWKTAAECAGKTDYDIPCNAVEFADEFIKMDKQAMDFSERSFTLDMQNYSLGWKLLLVERNPVHDELDVVSGLFNQCFDVSNTNQFRSFLALHQLDNKIFGANTKPASYSLTQISNPFDLTEKQENCLFFLIRGKTIKEIAKIFNVSPRTIESHLAAIKVKLNCISKSDVIEKIINSGLIYYVPNYIRENNLHDRLK